MFKQGYKYDRIADDHPSREVLERAYANKCPSDGMYINHFQRTNVEGVITHVPTSQAEMVYMTFDDQTKTREFYWVTLDAPTSLESIPVEEELRP